MTAPGWWMCSKCRFVRQARALTSEGDDVADTRLTRNTCPNDGSLLVQADENALRERGALPTTTEDPKRVPVENLTSGALVGQLITAAEWSAADDEAGRHARAERQAKRVEELRSEVLRRLGVGDDDEAVHGWFGLSYANYAVLARSILQSMPPVWQRRFVALMEEVEHAVERHGVPRTDYVVLVPYDDLGDVLLKVVRDQGLVKDDPVPEYNRGRTRLWSGE